MRACSAATAGLTDEVVTLTTHAIQERDPFLMMSMGRWPLTEGPTPAASETYRWQGELVSLDEGGRALTVKSRIVTPDGLADVVGLGAERSGSDT